MLTIVPAVPRSSVVFMRSSTGPLVVTLDPPAMFSRGPDPSASVAALALRKGPPVMLAPPRTSTRGPDPVNDNVLPSTSSIAVSAAVAIECVPPLIDTSDVAEGLVSWLPPVI